MENHQIITELNGKKYLLIEVVKWRKNQKELTEDINKFECIYQGIKQVQSETLLKDWFAILKILVPEEHAFKFNKYFK
jgi:hypothetical protein